MYHELFRQHVGRGGCTPQVHDSHSFSRGKKTKFRYPVVVGGYCALWELVEWSPKCLSVGPQPQHRLGVQAHVGPTKFPRGTPCLPPNCQVFTTGQSRVRNGPLTPSTALGPQPKITRARNCSTMGWGVLALHTVNPHLIPSTPYAHTIPIITTRGRGQK